jgi:hypothetical protein
VRKAFKRCARLASSASRRRGSVNSANARQIALELGRDVRHHQDPVFLANRFEHLLARAGMIACDARQRRPVDARRRNSLRRIGTVRTHPLLVARPRPGPKAVERRLVLGIKALHSEHGNVAMLGVDPRKRARRCSPPHKSKHCSQEARQVFRIGPCQP